MGKLNLKYLGELVFAQVNTGVPSFIPREDLLGVVRGPQWTLETENAALPDLQRRVESSRWWSQGVDMQCGHGGQDRPYDPPGGLVFSIYYWGCPGGSDGKESACNAGDPGLISESGRYAEEMAIHSSILAWRIPWTEEPGGLQSMGSQKVRQN